MALVHLGTDQIQHAEQPPTLITMASVKGDTLSTLNTGTIGPMLTYKSRLALSRLQWTRCGPESVPRLVLTLDTSYLGSLCIKEFYLHLLACFFWYWLTQVVPDKIYRAVKRLCVCCVLLACHHCLLCFDAVGWSAGRASGL